MDFARYKELKAKGSVQLQKVGTRAILFERSFHTESGEENPPGVVTINPVELLKARDQTAAALDGFDTLIADIEALEVKIRP